MCCNEFELVLFAQASWSEKFSAAWTKKNIAFCRNQKYRMYNCGIRLTPENIFVILLITAKENDFSPPRQARCVCYVFQESAIF